MGYLKPRELEELPLPSDPSYKVWVKRRPTWGDKALVRANFLKPMIGADGEMGADMDMYEYWMRMTVAMIDHWNLTDEDDQPLPVTAESLAQLYPEDGDFLRAQAEERMSAKRPESEEAPLGSTSTTTGATGPVTPPIS